MHGWIHQTISADLFLIVLRQPPSSLGWCFRDGRLAAYVFRTLLVAPNASLVPTYGRELENSDCLTTIEFLQFPS